jgi:hypothetical protein
MNTNPVTPGSGSADWDFPTLAGVWDAPTRAIVAGADRIEARPETDRVDSLMELSERIRTLAGALDDGWLVFTASFMIDDLYKSYFNQFRWSAGVHNYIEATAGEVVAELARRGFVLHYVVDSTAPETELDEKLTFIPAVFEAAGLLVTGPQLMALEAMEKIDHRSKDVTAIPFYRAEGHAMADELIARCHQERRSSVYLNVDLDDDTPGLALDVALSASNTPGAIAVFRDQPPVPGSAARLAPPPGIRLPEIGGPR